MLSPTAKPRQVKEREKARDKEMIQNLKKTLPNTDSQNQREIDVITKPSTRAQQRKQFLDTAFNKMIQGESFGLETKGAGVGRNCGESMDSNG